MCPLPVCISQVVKIPGVKKNKAKIIIIFKPTSTNPQAGKLGQTYKIMAATAIYSVTMVLWKETAFPLCRATEKRWKRNVVSRVSSVIVVIRLPISCVSSMAMYQLSLWQMGSVYWPIWSICLSCSVLSCGLLHLVYLPCCQWDSANVSGTVTFQAFLSPMAGEWSHLGVCFHPASG